eukprot:TRINITY_DN5017_c0_g1_i2.p1 TRINITY_DN5017_c0_g1~~TRINITY_DN5017_c0_g1_i2.p1  ORF type:complete len:337 (+),score=65.05 TRINITY_DN5017_c0_g1_i2:66-1076(+)
MAEVELAGLGFLEPEVFLFSSALVDALTRTLQGRIDAQDAVDLPGACSRFVRWILQQTRTAAREFISVTKSFIRYLPGTMLKSVSIDDNRRRLDEQLNILLDLLDGLYYDHDRAAGDFICENFTNRVVEVSQNASQILSELKGDLNFMINLTDGAIVVSFLGAFGSFFTYAARKQAEKAAIANAPAAAGFVLKHAAPIVANSVARGAIPAIIGAVAAPVGIVFTAISLISFGNQIRYMYTSQQVAELEKKMKELNLRQSLVYRTWGKTFIDANKFQEGIESYVLALACLDEAHKGPHRDIAELCKEIANFFRGVDDEKRRQYEAKAEDILRSLNAS